VSLDGSPAGARAVAIRSALLLVDQLLVCYLSRARQHDPHRACSAFALLASVAFAYAIAEAGNQPLTDAQRAQFITQCQSTAGQLIDCGCVLTQLEAAGYDTPNDLNNLIAEGELKLPPARLAALAPSSWAPLAPAAADSSRSAGFPAASQW